MVILKVWIYWYLFFPNSTIIVKLPYISSVMKKKTLLNTKNNQWQKYSWFCSNSYYLSTYCPIRLIVLLCCMKEAKVHVVVKYTKFVLIDTGSSYCWPRNLKGQGSNPRKGVGADGEVKANSKIYNGREFLIAIVCCSETLKQYPHCRGASWYSGSALNYLPTGRVIDPAPGAWFITKFIWIAQVVPSPV